MRIGEELRVTSPALVEAEPSIDFGEVPGADCLPKQPI